MATSVWKGYLSGFGLVSIPVKLYRAARAEKVGFRQVHEGTGTRVRQALFRELGEPLSGPVPVAPGQRHEPLRVHRTSACELEAALSDFLLSRLKSRSAVRNWPKAMNMSRAAILS